SFFYRKNLFQIFCLHLYSSNLQFNVNSFLPYFHITNNAPQMSLPYETPAEPPQNTYPLHKGNDLQTDILLAFHPRGVLCPLWNKVSPCAPPTLEWNSSIPSYKDVSDRQIIMKHLHFPLPVRHTSQ